MEWLDVLRRIEAGEDDMTEFKRGSVTVRKCVSLCLRKRRRWADRPRRRWTPGAIVGVKENAESVQERLTAFLQTGCSVPISARSGRHEDPNGWVHWIEVPRQPRGFEPLHCDGRFWIRRQRSSVEPSPSERQELFNNFGFVLTEEQVIRAAGVDDIDVGAFRAFLRAQGLDADDDPQPSIEDDMRNAGVLAGSDGRLVPTLYGVMAFGRDPQNHPQTSSFFIQCAAYAGTDSGSDAISVGESKGRLEDQILRSLDGSQV